MGRGEPGELLTLDVLSCAAMKEGLSGVTKTDVLPAAPALSVPLDGVEGPFLLEDEVPPSAAALARLFWLPSI